MEVTLQINKRELGEQKGRGGHSKHHARTDAGEGKREWRTLSREAKGESKKVPRWKGNTKRMEDSLHRHKRELG